MTCTLHFNLLCFLYACMLKKRALLISKLTWSKRFPKVFWQAILHEKFVTECCTVFQTLFICLLFLIYQIVCFVLNLGSPVIQSHFLTRKSTFSGGHTCERTDKNTIFFVYSCMSMVVISWCNLQQSLWNYTERLKKGKLSCFVCVRERKREGRERLVHMISHIEASHSKQHALSHMHIK